MKTVIKTLLIAATALGLSFCADNKGAADSNNGASNGTKTSTNTNHDNKDKKGKPNDENKGKAAHLKNANDVYKDDLDRIKKSIEKRKGEKNKVETVCRYKYYFENEKFHNHYLVDKKLHMMKNTEKDVHTDTKLKKKSSTSPAMIYLFPHTKVVALMFEYPSTCKDAVAPNKKLKNSFKDQMKKDGVGIDFGKAKLIQREITQTINTVIIVPK